MSNAIEKVTYDFDDKAQALPKDARKAIMLYAYYFYGYAMNGKDKKKAVEYYRTFSAAWRAAYGNSNFHVQETGRGVNFARVHIGEGPRA